jgi:NAD(P)-dependent dehydrogenase (short-subunit alcohol dehydrogenase family)
MVDYTMKVVITGANRGIGLALTLSYLEQNAQVIAVCRHASEELKQSSATIIDGVDVSNPETLSRLTDHLQRQSVDILINNAGVLAVENINEPSPTTIEQQFRVNALGPLLVTQALLDNLTKGSKIAMITSRMGSISDNGSGGYYGYRMSKAALNAAGHSIAKDLYSRGIAVVMLHPGYVQTEMVGYGGDIDAATSAARLQQRITELSLDSSGDFLHSNGQQLPW